MFGISWAEFLVILLVAVLVIPARLWPDVARWLARAITYVRKTLWRITDAGEQIKQQIDLEQPIDDLIRTTTQDVLSQISTPLKGADKTGVRSKSKNTKNSTTANKTRAGRTK